MSSAPITDDMDSHPPPLGHLDLSWTGGARRPRKGGDGRMDSTEWNVGWARQVLAKGMRGLEARCVQTSFVYSKVKGPC